MTDTPTRSVAFVLASWTPNAPAGMERATAAVALGLAERGHHAIIITATAEAPNQYDGVEIVGLAGLPLSLPCNDDTLRAATQRHRDAIARELTNVYLSRQVDTAVYVDALWGLGAIMPTDATTRRVLAAHVVGHDTDLRAALDRRPHAVIAPSPVVLDRATARGYDTASWSVVPNGLLSDPKPGLPARRRQLRDGGPIRVLARLGPEKGVEELLRAAPADLDRRTQVALAAAGFDNADQSQLWDRCRSHADQHPGMTVRFGMGWREVPGWLADAAVVIVPSLRETFGLVALEAMSVGTPVVAYAVDHLPALIETGGVLVPVQEDPAGLWRAATTLLADPVTYEATSRAAYYRTRDYRPALVADQLLKVVS
ncbi:MAG TPA: glycosyltransferase family 4 protein [Pseudonocardiaceae bacterium]|nr:glycosyltransferase family 4 protein [Pseudonocardiaceae bacterium]